MYQFLRDGPYGETDSDWLAPANQFVVANVVQVPEVLNTDNEFFAKRRNIPNHVIQHNDWIDFQDNGDFATFILQVVDDVMQGDPYREDLLNYRIMNVDITATSRNDIPLANKRILVNRNRLPVVTQFRRATHIQDLEFWLRMNLLTMRLLDRCSRGIYPFNRIYPTQFIRDRINVNPTLDRVDVFLNTRVNQYTLRVFAQDMQPGYAEWFTHGSLIMQWWSMRFMQGIAADRSGKLFLLALVALAVPEAINLNLFSALRSW